MKPGYDDKRYKKPPTMPFLLLEQLEREESTECGTPDGVGACRPSDVDAASQSNDGDRYGAGENRNVGGREEYKLAEVCSQKLSGDYWKEKNQNG
jgi:hypothetical protein